MGSRARGEGNITKRKDGSYAGSIQKNGKRHFVYARTKGECAEKLRELKRQLDDGVDRDGSSLKLKEYLARWLDWNEVRVSYRTQQSYRQVVRDHLEEALGHLTLRAITPEVVERHLAALTRAGKGGRTVQYTRSVLSRALNTAVRWRYLSVNPVSAVSSPRVRRKPFKVLNPEEVGRLLTAVQGHWLEPLYWTAVLTGLRKGELLALQLDDLDLAAGTLRVRATLQWQGGRLVRGETKTEASQRTLPIPGVLLDRLRKHSERQRERFPSNTFLFTSSAGTPLNPRNLNRHFERLLELSELPAVTFHSLRHACATDWVASGVNIRTVAALLGHSRTSTTLDIYTSTVPETLREAVELRGSAVRSAVEQQKSPEAKQPSGHLDAVQED